MLRLREKALLGGLERMLWPRVSARKKTFLGEVLRPCETAPEGVWWPDRVSETASEEGKG